MSREIPTELAAAQGAPSRKYGWRVVAGDCPCEAPRFDWSPIYESGESQPFSAMVLGGTIYRARVSFAGYLLIDDVANPTSDAEWASGWRWNLGQVATDYSPVCITYLDRLGAGPTPAVFYLRRADGSIAVRWLDLATMVWGAEVPVHVVSAGQSIRGLHLDPSGGGTWLVALLDRGSPAGGDEDPIVVRYDAATDSWLPAVEMVWGHYDTEGIASVFDGSHVHFWFKAGLGGAHLYYGSYRVADGTWGATRVVAAGENGFANLRPVAGYDPELGRWILVWRETCPSPAIDRHVICLSPVPDCITERIPAPTTRAWELLLTRAGEHWYLLGSNVAYRGAAWTASAEQKVDLSSRVVAVEEEYPAPNRPGRLSLLLENADGALAGVGQGGGTFRPLRLGSQIALGLGVETAGRLYYAWRSPWYIESLTFEEERGTAHLRVECTDPMGILHTLRPVGQPSWTGATAREVLWHVLYRVTVTPLPPAGALDTSVGWLSVGPGTDWGELAEALLRWAGAIARWRTRATVLDGVGPGVVEAGAVGLAEGEAAAAFGGPGEPPVIGVGLSVVRPQELNRVQVFGGESHFGEARDSDHQVEQSRDLVRVISDRKLIGDGDCAAVAQQRLRWAQLASEGGWIEVYPDFALEVGDVVRVTVERAGVVSREYRIVAMRTVLDSRRGRYVQRLHVGRR